MLAIIVFPAILTNHLENLDDIGLLIPRALVKSCLQQSLPREQKESDLWAILGDLGAPNLVTNLEFFMTVRDSKVSITILAN